MGHHNDIAVVFIDCVQNWYKIIWRHCRIIATRAGHLDIRDVPSVVDPSNEGALPILWSAAHDIQPGKVMCVLLLIYLTLTKFMQNRIIKYRYGNSRSKSFRQTAFKGTDEERHSES